ncbi:histidine kinase [Halobacteriaceae archaeon GCM10025711]
MSGQAQETGAELGYGAATGNEWKGGLLAGLAGGLVMGALISLMNPAVLAGGIAGLYGLEVNGLAGWIVHMSNSAVFGVVFAAAVELTGLRKYADNLGAIAGLGAAYGVVLWVVAAGLVMPIWLSAVGFASPPPFPNFNPVSLFWHVAYGAVLGAVYPAVRTP